MHPLRVDEPGKKLLLLGNEAIVRGALEAGVAFASTYPGTPASEIGDTFFRLKDEAGIVFEYSTNEKVALEVAAGPAAAGVRSLVCMKHVGLNVAADPLMTLAYTGVRGGMVIVTADDPGCHSSQNEQDNRYFALLASLPMLEPSTPQEAYEMTRFAFELSERVELPVLLRTTTRVSHTRGIVLLGEMQAKDRRAFFKKEPLRFVPVPAVAKTRHPVLLKNFGRAAEILADSNFNSVFGEGDFGVVTSGVAACYVEDALKEMNLLGRVKVLKLGTTHPIPDALCAEFLSSVPRVLVAEELEPFLEEKLKVLAQERGIAVSIFGKASGHFSRLSEFTPDGVRGALASLLGIELEPAPAHGLPAIPPRPPILCPSCPHRSTYYLMKMAVRPDTIFMTDIGCYTLGFAPPLSMGDFFLCMGSSITKASGLSTVSDQPIVAFIGDSTFFHSGMTGLVNAVNNNRSFTLVIMDNGTTGMTGHQPHPGAMRTPEGGQTVSIEAVARAAGVKNLAVIDPSDLRASYECVREVRARGGLSVIISRSPCPLYARKELGIARPKTRYTVLHDRCKTCGRRHDCLVCGLEAKSEYGLRRSLARLLSEAPTLEDFHQDRTEKMEESPCSWACPAGICVQGYVNRIAAGLTGEAMDLIRQRVPLPGVLGRLCERPCEKACVRGDFDESLAVDRLKRYATDCETDEDRARFVECLKSRIVKNGKKVAVIGSGPAGLTCAYDLTVRGYDATIFEAENAIGGIPGIVVPRHRLPREVLDRDLQVFRALGIEMKTGVTVGVHLTVQELLEEGFAAVFLGIGARLGAKMHIPGEELPGVEDALAFLKRVNLGTDRSVGKHVVVIGGGNSAMDSARTAVRLGAEKVTILYRRSRAEMPARASEVHAAHHEGVALHYLGVPFAFRGTSKLEAIECRRTQLGELDNSGRRSCVVTDDGFRIEADHAIVAVGQTLDDTPARNGLASLTGCRGFIAADSATGATPEKGIFAGGDAATGPATVIDAIAAGKRAAYGIDLYLSEDPKKVPVEIDRDPTRPPDVPRYHPKYVAQTKRLRPEPRLSKDILNDFTEVERTFTPEEALKESSRCLSCGLCESCNNCLDNFGCPAFYKEDGKIYIDRALCDGCGVCVQVCPNGAIVPVEAAP